MSVLSFHMKVELGITFSITEVETLTWWWGLRGLMNHGAMLAVA